MATLTLWMIDQVDCSVPFSPRVTCWVPQRNHAQSADPHRKKCMGFFAIKYYKVIYWVYQIRFFAEVLYFGYLNYYFSVMELHQMKNLDHLKSAKPLFICTILSQLLIKWSWLWLPSLSFWTLSEWLWRRSSRSNEPSAPLSRYETL